MNESGDVVALHARSVAHFLRLVEGAADADWSAATPCPPWDVRELVNHVVGEDRWTAPLLDGRTIEQVGDQFDGDLLGDAPLDSAHDAGRSAMAAFAEPAVLARTVHLSFGDTPASEYAWQLAADHLIHAWDLAAATGGDRRLDPDVVDGVAAWFADREELYRGAGAIGPRPDVEATSAQDRLLVAFGRDPGWTAADRGARPAAEASAPASAEDVVSRFGAAWEAWDIEAVMALMADDAVFESTGPAPDGTRVEGAAAIRELWTEMFEGTVEPRFTFEESFVCGDRAAARWEFSWAGGHVRGADVIRVRDGKVTEKLSYVKG
ncbi:MAG: hypothetical protein QOJ90_2249 [Actinomycetota bacterium]|jgi:uncharacterized protein (TIGR03086 family)|nr:hypothetical protein [Actinomycetota bacterium]